jgi:hypothetical protein
MSLTGWLNWSVGETFDGGIQFLSNSFWFALGKIAEIYT